MNFTKPVIIILILFFLTAIQSIANTENQQTHLFTLNDLYKIAENHAERIKISEIDVNISENVRNKAKSALFPQVDVFTNFGTYDDRTYSNPTSLNNGIRAGYRFTLNGNELTALNISEQNIDKSSIDHNKVIEDYLFQVNNGYYNIILAQQAVSIADSNIERLEENKKSVEIRLELEDVTVTSLYRSQAELSSAMASKTRAMNSVKLARASLREMVDLPENFEIVIPDDLSFNKPDLNKLSLYEEALEKRLDIQSLTKADEISDSSIKWYKGEFWPTVSIEAAYNNTYVDPEAPDYDDDNLGLRAAINFNLFDGGYKKANVREAYYSKSQLNLTLKDLKEKIYLEIEQACLDIVSQYEVLESLDDQLKYSTENNDAVTNLFSQGLANIIDVIDANTLLVQSEIQMLEARYKYIIAQESLKKAKGDFLNSTN